MNVAFIFVHEAPWTLTGLVDVLHIKGTHLAAHRLPSADRTERAHWPPSIFRGKGTLAFLF